MQETKKSYYDISIILYFMIPDRYEKDFKLLERYHPVAVLA